jgi:hypothetical protein
VAIAPKPRSMRPSNFSKRASVFFTYHRPIGHVESVMLEREKRFVPVVQRSVPEIVVESGRVIDWLRDRAIPANGTTVTNLEVLHADYEVWCMQKEL